MNRAVRSCLLLLGGLMVSTRVAAQTKVSIGAHLVMSPYFGSAYGLQYAQSLDRLGERLGGGLSMGFRTPKGWEIGVAIEHESVFVTSSGNTIRRTGHQRLGGILAIPIGSEPVGGGLHFGIAGSFENFAGPRAAPSDGVIVGGGLFWRDWDLGFRPTIDLLAQRRVYSVRRAGGPSFPENLGVSDGWQLAIRVGVRLLVLK